MDLPGSSVFAQLIFIAPRERRIRERCTRERANGTTLYTGRNNVLSQVDRHGCISCSLRRSLAPSPSVSRALFYPAAFDSLRGKFLSAGLLFSSRSAGIFFPLPFAPVEGTEASDRMPKE